MAHPTRTGDLVVVLVPAVPVRRGDARHADRALGVLRPARLRAGRAGPATQHEHARDVPRRRHGDRARRGATTSAASTSRRRRRSCSASRRRSTARASCGATCSTTAARYTPVSIIGLNDFHGQLDPTTTHDRRAAPSASAARRSWRRCSTRRPTRLPGRTLLLAAGDNVGASPPNSALLEDTPGDRRRERVGARRHELRQPRVRLRRRRASSAHEARANFPFLSANIVDEDTGETPDWLEAVDGVPRQRRARRRDRRDGQDDAGARAARAPPQGLRVPRRGGADPARVARGCARRASRSRSSSSTRAPSLGANAIDGQPAAPWAGPIIGIVEALQDTTVDLVIAGHTHRVANTVVGRIPVVEGFNAGGSYSVAQLMVTDGDVAWAGAATRMAKNLGVAPRPTCRRSSTRPTPTRRRCATR